MNPDRGPACPRCGYDLSGHVRAWEHGLEARATGGFAAGGGAAGAACPLEGVCPECGLEFAWREVMRPEFGVPRWSFEHAPAGRLGSGLVRAWVGTGARVFWPRALLGRLGMPHPVVVGRLVWFAVGALVLVGVLMELAAAWVASHDAMTPNPWGGPSPVEAAIHALRSPLATLGGLGIDSLRDYAPPWLPWLACATVAMPAAFVLLPDTFRRAKARRSHLLRLGAYSVLGAVCVWLLWMAAMLCRSWYRGPFDDTVVEEGARWLVRSNRALVGAWFVWFVAYWWQGVRRYLRLEHAGGVLAAMLVMAGLLGAVGQVLVFLATREVTFVFGRESWW